MSGGNNDLVHAVLAGLNESQSKGGLIIRKKKEDGTPAGFQVRWFNQIFSWLFYFAIIFSFTKQLPV
jgi:hypothetical protein